MAQYQLPNDFFFGAAMSGPQTEGQWNQGGKLENLWDTWSIQDLGSFYNRVGSYAGNDFMAKYQEDLRILKDLGLDTYRTSIQWSRLLDADGNLNEEGAAWYHELFRASREAGLEPFVNLYHFDMPTYLFNRGGWESREVVEAYAHYADVAFHEFGQEIKYWFTFNEPIVEPEQRYQEGVWFPQLHDFNRARTVQYHISLAHALAVANYRRAYDEGAIRADAKIGMINCFTPVYTKENPSNSSHPTRVQAPASKVDQYGLPHFADEYVWPDAVMNESRGWEIYPQGLYDFGMDCAKNYPDLEWFVSENGIGIMDEYKNRDAEGTIQDDYRVDFVRQHLEWVAKAIAEGAKCRGYHYWAVIDNWSWANAFKNRYGFVEVDLMDGYKRRLKKSAAWLKQVATTHVVD